MQQLTPGVLSPPQRRMFYGWGIVLIGCLQDAVKGGLFNTGFSLYFLPVLTKRGLAMSILQTGQAIGGVVLFPLVALAVLKLGWRSAALLSGGVIFLTFPLVLLIRRSPESMGLLTDGEPHPSPSLARHRRPPRDLVELTPQEALRSSAFWLIAGFHSLRNIPYTGVTVHLVPLLVWKGFDQSTAAFFVGLMSFSAVIVRPLSGWLGDRWSKQKIGATGVILGGLGLGVLLYSSGTI